MIPEYLILLVPEMTIHPVTVPEPFREAEQLIDEVPVPLGVVLFNLFGDGVQAH